MAQKLLIKFQFDLKSHQKDIFHVHSHTICIQNAGIEAKDDTKKYFIKIPRFETCHKSKITTFCIYNQTLHVQIVRCAASSVVVYGEDLVLKITIFLFFCSLE